MINLYPAVDFSKKLIEISKSKPTLPQMPSIPIKPSEPIMESEGIGCGSSLFTGIAVCFSIICVIALFASQIQVALTVGLIAGVALLILYSISNSEVNKNQRNIENMKQYKLKCKKFEEDLLVYDKKQKEYESQIKILSSIEYIHKYRSELLEKQISRDKQLFNDLSKTKLSFKSLVISYFAPFLLKAFSKENIIQAVVFDDFYLPFVVYDESGIIINIEIDKPYDENTGIPESCKEDFFENKFDRIRSLNKLNITTVRFCEEQVFKYPNECVKFIEVVKRKLLDNDTYISECDFPYIIPEWTKEESYSMAFKRYRDSYIPKNIMNYDV